MDIANLARNSPDAESNLMISARDFEILVCKRSGHPCINAELLPKARLVCILKTSSNRLSWVRPGVCLQN